jgi:hypothetical protein
MDSDGIMKYIQSLLEQMDESNKYVQFRSLLRLLMTKV